MCITCAAVEKGNLVYFGLKNVDFLTYGETKEGGAGAMGFSITGATGHNISMVYHSDDRVMKYAVQSMTFVTAEMYKDGNVLQDQMVFGVFYARGTDLIFLKKHRMSKRKMFVVLPRMVEAWLKGKEPTYGEKLVCPVTPQMVEGFLRGVL